jgi:hypothetical protein
MKTSIDEEWEDTVDRYMREPRVELARAPLVGDIGERRRNVIRAVLQLPRVYTISGVLDATRRRSVIRQQARRQP